MAGRGFPIVRASGSGHDQSLYLLLPVGRHRCCTGVLKELPVQSSSVWIAAQVSCSGCTVHKAVCTNWTKHERTTRCTVRDCKNAPDAMLFTTWANFNYSAALNVLS